jgi:hypothetical protein
MHIFMFVRTLVCGRERPSQLPDQRQVLYQRVRVGQVNQHSYVLYVENDLEWRYGSLHVAD